ncbi:two component transcriptional regulator, LytTR family [Fibrisoma limi BUZ 3]|uniref:Two component transcriptional regulator, LytTR family n=1 Tax=Fibrisoma limi BUZ 3 TaxID=1185876 RepID=I2GDA6_9BACT|nr:response regulator [Fibrisoma limi]CCH51880.1 two component transcriptional regulator, LytTR family [Fibrisoma limi BUZ 3]
MATSINILIIEDEAVLSMDLSDLLEEEGYFVTATANNGPKALSLHRQNQIDLALCDIHIKGEWDGIETAERLLAERAIPIIFLTALTDKLTLERAMRLYPAAYLIKPVTLPGLRAAVELALRTFTQSMAKVPDSNPGVSPAAVVKEEVPSEPILRIDDAVFVKHKYQFVKIKIAEIEYLEADSSYTFLVTSQHRYALRLTISQVLTRLNLPRLVRIHRSYAVNLNWVSTFNEREVCLPTITLPLGRLYKPDFMRHFTVQ